MENATKALLIAAAVLVVIVIIALGVRLLGTAGDTSSKAQTVSNDLDKSAEKAVGDVTSALQKANLIASGTESR